MVHYVGRRIFWMVFGSTVLATFIALALYKAGLISLQEGSPSDKETKQKKKRIRIGKVKLS